MPSPRPIFYDCGCIDIYLRAIGEFQAEILALSSSESFAINANGFILMKLYILISSTQICQVELPLAGEPLLSDSVPKEHWATLGSKGHLALIPRVGVFSQAVLREPGNWVIFLLLAA